MKIQSVSDIITNSSSEVFIIDTVIADELIGHKFDYAWTEIIDDEFIISHPLMIEDFCDAAGIEKPKFDFQSIHGKSEMLYALKSFIDDHKDEFDAFYGNNRYSFVTLDEWFGDSDVADEVTNKSIWQGFY